MASETPCSRIMVKSTSVVNVARTLTPVTTLAP
jgi:hypothetical protein